MQHLRQQLQQAIAQDAIYGVSYGLIEPQHAQLGYLGHQGPQPPCLITPQMQYDLASLTKVVATTTRLLQLLCAQKISLTDKLGNYLPDVGAKDATITELLLHISGLPADLPDYHGLTKAELIAKLKQVKPIRQNRGQVCYSDLGFIYLGWVIEKVDGNLTQSLTRNIFAPLKMASTQFNPQPSRNIVPTEQQAKRGGVICGQVHDGKAYLLGGVSGHAGLFSTLEDLTNFVQMYLHQGMFQQQMILPPQAFNLLAEMGQDQRTLGWQRWQKTPTKLWHTGFTGTSIGIDLLSKRGFICLTNRIYPTRQKQAWLKIRQELAQQFFAGELQE